MRLRILVENGDHQVYRYKNPPRERKMTVENPTTLSADSQQLLLQIARDAIASHLSNRAPSEFQITDSALVQAQGAFVSLHKGEKLRGCIGHIVSDKPLHQTITEVAIAAATHDPRFDPVTLEEMSEIEIEISVLTPLQRVQSVDEIAVGVEGLYIIRGEQSGLLLPQVAATYGWDLAQFLQQTCKKAALPDNAWLDPRTEIYRFSAQVFGE